jgi:uncharacterized protein (TIGR03083 family)
MTKQELISTIEAERAKLDTLIGTLSDAQMNEPNAVGEWSVKDTLAHLAMWTSRNITVIYQAEQGQKAEELDEMFDDADALNAADYETQKDRPLDRILSDLRGTHKQLLRRLNAWNEADLFDQTLYSWLRGQSLGDFLVDAVGHAATHRKLIEQWRQ